MTFLSWPEYHMRLEAQQFLAELQQQKDMANDPDDATLLQAQGMVSPEKIARPHGTLSNLYCLHSQKFDPDSRESG